MRPREPDDNTIQLETKLEAIEQNLEESEVLLEESPLRDRRAWMPLLRASVRARFLSARLLHNLEVPFSFGTSNEQRAYISKTLTKPLQRVGALWSDTKDYLRFGYRPAEEEDRATEPLTREDVTKVRRSVYLARRRVLKSFDDPRFGRGGYGAIPETSIPDRSSPSIRIESLERVSLDGLAAPQFDIAVGASAPDEGGAQYQVSVPRVAALTIRKDGTVDPHSNVPDRERLSWSEYKKARTYPVWFATSQLGGPPPRSKDRFPQITFGLCNVHVPRTHQFGSLGSNWLVRTVERMLGREDDKLRITRTVPLDRSDFRGSISSYLAHWKKRTALVIVHGYNVSFDEAVRRSAQIGFDLQIDGITACFSWPSRAKLFSYMQDEETSRAAEPCLIEFIGELSRTEDIDEIHILAHSMGNRLLYGAVEKLANAYARGDLSVPVGQIILAAGDVWPDHFNQHLPYYRAVAKRRLTNYSCTQDIPLRISQFLHRHTRIGLEPPIFVAENVDSISAANLDLHGLGHSYYAETEALLYDLSEILHHNTAPAARVRLEEAATAAGDAYWTFRK